MSQAPQEIRIFDDRRSGVRKYVVLPWRRTIEICWLNVQHRIGRSMLTFVCVAVVVAFFASSLGYQDIVSSLLQSDDVHAKAVLEKAGISAADVAGLKKHRDQRTWLMTLSGILCVVGIMNTILMSVTERYREIGTLKCLGALDSFVVRLFMIESLFIGLLGSIAGAVAGFCLGLLQAGASLEFGLLSASRCLHALAVGVPVSIALGTTMTVLAAAYPTYVAARMKPVEAMRAEV